MNLLLPISAIGAYLLFKPKPTTTKSNSTSGKTIIKKPSLSDDCNWYCPGNEIINDGYGADYDFAKELYNNQKLFDKLLAEYWGAATEPWESDFGIQYLTKGLLKTWKVGKCKSIKSEISIEDTLTLRYSYANALPTAAFYLALTEKITDLQLSMWLAIEYPKLLASLGLLIPGQYKLEYLQQRFDSISPEKLQSFLSKLYILIPEFRNIQAELAATILMIQLSQIVEVEVKDKCFKITKMQYGDFSSLGGKLDPAYQELFNKIYSAVIIAKEK